MKGIILAGGSGTRLAPATRAVSKQLLPIYDKPMIYYPLSVLMLGGIRDILIITTPRDRPLFESLLGDGSQWGVSLGYATQERPEGLPQAFLIGAEFLDGQACTMILGDNLLFGEGLGQFVAAARRSLVGARSFCTRVQDPARYGVVAFDPAGAVASIQEKPRRPRSDWALVGLYVFDGSVVSRAAQLKPSRRGELEIVDLLKAYLDEGQLQVAKLGRGYAWFDAGTHDSLLEASEFVRTIESRQGLKVACLEEIALSRKFIDLDRFRDLAASHGDTPYGRYLREVAEEEL